ncbi:MAG: isoprenylcysteine carboxylmethyltransferase family protein [Gemmatimonadales bacterium]|nr:isoprenylcysteine carboxylmethyltransferase family protein [Gemmatimonadales bacterium]
MLRSLPFQLGVLFLLSEIILHRVRRLEPGSGRNADRGSGRLIWGVITPAIVVAAWPIPMYATWGYFPLGPAAHAALLALFLGGLAFRWWAVRTLGRFFTVKVGILEGHELVGDGPYRWLRHPAYTGVLAQFLALALSFQQVLSALLIVAAVAGVFAYRIVVEERALAEAFGAQWAAHAATRARLVPGLW